MPQTVSASLRLQIERLNLLYTQNLRGIISLVFLAVAYLTVAWASGHREFAEIWAAIVFSSAVVRVVMSLAWNRLRDQITSHETARRWERGLEAMLLLSGFAWGALGWRMPSEPVSVQIVTTASVVMMSAGAMVAYAASYRMMMLIMAPSFVIWSISLFIAGGPLYPIIGAMLMLICLLSVVVGRDHNAYIVRGLKLNIENGDLTARLKSQVDSLEKAQEELRRTEDLRREQSEAEASNRAKSVLLANASHEIRTPLAAINGFSDMLLQNPALAEDVRSDLKMISRNGKYLVALVNDLLDLSKIENGQMYIQKSFISPLTEIQDVVALMRPTIEERGLRFDVQIDRLPSRIHSDSTRLREILINLLTNAAKFTDQGVVSMRASFNEASSALRIVIEDSGIGISEEAAKTLFRPFSRGLSARVQRVPGSGLGLALSKNLARLLGGNLVLLNSGATSGAKFELTIDAGPNALLCNDVDAKPVVERAGRPMSAARRLEGRRILVVDDSKDLQVLMKRYLIKQGAEVSVRENGAEALELLRQSEFDLVLMDIKMPVLDGYSATRAARDAGYRRAIVAVTAHASTDDRQRCFRSGFDSYVSKPVDFDHLVDDLSKFLPVPN